ncbi:MAG: hypothetical protein KJ626_15770 [Verrucomicrobia bacterium]|nr:hypothetical protein [Verrucomicrobiota bacterium]
MSGRTRTALDRANGTLVSTVASVAANHSGSAAMPPIDLTVDLVSGRVDRVVMPGASGGQGSGPYSKYYFNLDAKFTAGQFASGHFVGQALQFERPKYDRFMYNPGPRGGLLQQHPPTLNIVQVPPYVVMEGETLALRLYGYDADGEVVSIGASPILPNAAFTSASSLNATGDYVLATSPGQQGVYAVTFTAWDESGLSTSRVVQILVTPTNNPPTISAPASVSVNEGQNVMIPVTGSDPDGDPISIECSPLPDNAIFVQAGGGITFAPDYSQDGTYNITCRSYDGSLYSTDTIVSVTVSNIEATAESNQLVLVVDDSESPTLLTEQRVTGRVNAGTNLPPAQKIIASLITGLFPSDARQGDTNVSVLISGKGTGAYVTHFAAGGSSASFGDGITVNSLTVNNGTQAIANISVAASAATGARGVKLKTGSETAVAVPAFHVKEGLTTVSGRLVDSETGSPIVGALISIEGTVISTLSLLDGSFTLLNVPIGTRILLLNPTNHKLIRLPIGVEQGVPVDVGELATEPTVYDPSSAASASLFSILGRGLGDLSGRIDLQDAIELVRDTFLTLGAEEVGVWDEFGNELNPSLDTNNLFSISHKGVELYARRHARGEDVRLIDLLYDLSFGIKWKSGSTPSFTEWIAALQQILNDAWANPSDPNNAAAIAAFNTGRNLSPNPPVLNGATRLTKLQAFIMVSGFMSAAYHHRDDWVWAPTPPEDAFVMSLGESLSKAVHDFVCGPDAVAQVPGGKAGTYTITWERLAQEMGDYPTEAVFNSTNAVNRELPGFEDILSKYYMDGTTNSLAAARLQLENAFPGNPTIANIFNKDKYGVVAAVTSLVRITATDIHLRTNFIAIAGRDYSSGSIWAPFKVSWGHGTLSPMMFLALGTDPTVTSAVLIKSLAPAAPYLHSVKEVRRNIGSAYNPLYIPFVEILFYPSPDERVKKEETYAYRLWQWQPKGTTVSERAAMKIVAAGQETTDRSDFFSPHRDTNDTAKLVFRVPFPEPGHQYYRIDCIRGSENVVKKALDNTNTLAKVKPWLSGYLDDPLAASQDQVLKLGTRNIHPGKAFIEGERLDVSALSRVGSVFVRGAGTGFAPFGHIDLVADYDKPDRIYISIPDFKFNNDRGSGAIFLYRPEKSEMVEAVSHNSLFMQPGQVGMTMDSDGDLYAVNGASQMAYGGKIFKFYMDAVTGLATGRSHVANVNYFSQTLLRGRPTSIQDIAMGSKGTDAYDEELYLADNYDTTVKKIDVSWSEQYLGSNYANLAVAYHNVAKGLWGENESWSTWPDIFAFDAWTDLEFDLTKEWLYITQGNNIVRTKGDTAQGLFINGTVFDNATSCAFCESRYATYLFIADMAANRILRVPVSDLPLLVPSDPAQYSELMTAYTFIENVPHPMDVAIADDGKALIYVTDAGVQYTRFGFTGRALTEDDQPLVGAVVKLITAGGEEKTLADGNGYYTFGGYTAASVGILDVSHPLTNFTEDIVIDWRCGSTLRPAPCVVITSPADGEIVSNGTVTVRGTIFPADTDFTLTGGTLDASGGSYPLVFTGNDNDFIVNNVPLNTGDNYLTGRAAANGPYISGVSLSTRVRRQTAPATSQAVSGVAKDGDGNPIPGATVIVKVNGFEVTELTADGCGYYHEDGLPLGVLSVEVVE